MDGPRRSGWRRELILAAVLLAMPSLSIGPSRTAELGVLAGWWIAVDDNLPFFWRQNAIAPMEEILQIAKDGTVADRVLNLRPATAEACSDGRVCDVLPAIASARLQVSDTRFVFSDVVPTSARLDSIAGNLLIRQAAVTTISEWTATLEGRRMILRASSGDKVRILVQIEPNLVRELYAGMLLSNWPAQESWRCFLSHVTSRNAAFSGIHADRSYRRPAFVERYLQLAPYIIAVRATLALNEANSGERDRTPVDPGASIIGRLEEFPAPLTADDRKRLNDVLLYLDQQRRALAALNEASKKFLEVAPKANATAWETARKESVAKLATEMANAAALRLASATKDLERAQASSDIQAKKANEAYEAANRAIAAVVQEEKSTASAIAVAELTRRMATIQEEKAAAARRFGNDQKARYDKAVRAAALLARDLEQTKANAANQRQKADALAVIAKKLREEADAAKTTSEEVQRNQEAARGAVEVQQQNSHINEAAMQSLIETLGAARTIFDVANADAETETEGSPLALKAQAEVAERGSIAQRIMNALITARDHAQTEVQAAGSLLPDLIRHMQETETQAAQAIETEKSTRAAAEKAELEADEALREAARLAIAAREMEPRAVAADDLAKLTGTAQHASANLADSEHADTQKLTAIADEMTARAQKARERLQLVASKRDNAVNMSNQGVTEAKRLADLITNLGRELARVRNSANSARSADQEANRQFGIAEDASIRARNELDATSNAIAAIRESMNEAVANQPKSKGLISLSITDVAALAHVMDESTEAKALFCRGQPPAMARAIPKTSTSPSPTSSIASINSDVEPVLPARAPAADLGLDTSQSKPQVKEPTARRIEAAKTETISQHSGAAAKTKNEKTKRLQESKSKPHISKLNSKSEKNAASAKRMSSHTEKSKESPKVKPRAATR